MFPANVKLSKNELLLIENAEVILTKNRIIGKAMDLFGILSDVFRESIKENGNYLPKEVITIAPKIYKGEQYLGLPYVMLDYPRCFIKDDFFAIRSLCWWGNFLSIQILISGKYKYPFGENILQYFIENEIKCKEWFISVHPDPWHHHFETTNYIAATTSNLAELQAKPNSFIKLAKKIPLSEWERSLDFFTNNFNDLIINILNRNNSN